MWLHPHVAGYFAANDEVAIRMREQGVPAHAVHVAGIPTMPAFGWRRFKKELGPWHKHWAFGAPVDYWIFGAISVLLFWYGA